MTLSTEDLSPEEPSGLVTWMEPGALRLGGAGVAALLAGAFALGIVVATALLNARREAPPRGYPTVH